MSQQQIGPHNRQLVVKQALTVMAALGEFVQGVTRQEHWSAVARGNGLVAPGGATSVKQAAEDLQKFQEQAAMETQLAGRQLVQGIQSAGAAWSAMQKALELPPQAAPAPSSATKLAETAGKAA